jgi:hypothetical protein
MVLHVRARETTVRCSLLGEVAAANVAETGNVVEMEIVMEVLPAAGDDEMRAASGDEGHASSGGRTDDSVDEKASDDENSWTYNIRASTITLVRIKEWQRRDILRMVKPEHLGRKPCQSWRRTKLSYMRTFLLSACACLCILH